MLIITLILTCLMSQNVFEAGAATVRRKRALTGARWPTNRIPYEFSNLMEFDETLRMKIEMILKEIERQLSVNGRPCVYFTPKQYEEKDYILFRDDGVCDTEVGYSPGPNIISLTKECLVPSTIMHEIMHTLGFDHEHARFDRDDFIEISNDNLRTEEHFYVNKKSAENVENSPYDFLSITHFESDVQQKDKNKPTILSKVPILLSNGNKLDLERNSLSQIDRVQVQHLYECDKIHRPQIVLPINYSDLEKVNRISEIFKNEAAFVGISNDLIQKYMDRTFTTCGLDHYWDLKYPIVDSNHKHYEFICKPKKPAKEECLFTIECQDEQATCLRPFFINTGICFRTKYARVNKISSVVNDQIMKNGKIIKEESVVAKEKLKNVVDSSVDLAKSSYNSLKKIFG